MHSLITPPNTMLHVAWLRKVRFLQATLLVTIIFLCGTNPPMQYVCSGIAVFEENIAADEGKWTLRVFYALLCHSKKRTVTPCFVFSFVLLRLSVLLVVEVRLQRNCVFCVVALRL